MISEHLEHGATHAITAKELSKALGIDRRMLAKAIEQERRQGIPICASTDAAKPGYYLAANQAEFDAYTHQLWKRAGEIHKTRRMLMDNCKALPVTSEASEALG